MNRSDPLVLKKLLLLIVIAAALMSPRCVTASATPIVGVTNTVWRYLATGTDPGESWTYPAFDDSSWPTGRGLFGNETNYPFPMNTTVLGPGVGGPMTAYYRTRFQWQGSVSGITFLGTNYVDDGCVIYLNGVELTRFNMPDGACTYETRAVGGFFFEPISVPIGMELSNLTNGNANPLVEGENVLAVEVHQNSSASSDHVFGLSLGARPDFPCGIIEHPASQVVTACQTATFTVTPDFECFNPSYQWYFEPPGGQARPLFGYNESTLVLTDVQSYNIGFYFCQLTSVGKTLESQWASLNVNPDTDPPRVLYGYIPYVFGNENELRVVFDGPVYLISDYDDPSLWKVNARYDDIINFPRTVAAVHVTNRSEVAVFLTPPLDPIFGPWWNYWVESSYPISDWCSGIFHFDGFAVMCQNQIILDPSDPWTWRYHDTGIDPGTNWMQPSFDDTAWKTGEHVFDSNLARQPIEGWPIRTRLTVDVPNSNPPERIPTFLFRVHLGLPSNFAVDNAIGKAMHDDGFVLYVNGHEVFRRGVADDRFNAFGGSVATPEMTLQQPFQIPGSNFVSGDNLIAVQLKQANASSTDATFGLQLQILGGYTFRPPGIIDPPDSQNVTEGHTWSMEAVSSGSFSTNQWLHDGVAIPGATRSWLTGVARLTDAGAYQFQVSSLFGSIISEAATLRVEPVTLPYSATWRYQTNQQDASLAGTPWFAMAFDDSSWPTAPGPFGLEGVLDTLKRLPSPIATKLPVPGPRFRTGYFRTRVNIPPTPAGQTLMLCHVVDDGAAFYVDGQLALRYNLTNALPIYSTNVAAAQTPGDGDAQIVCTPFPLEAGEHLLAVEVHHQANDNLDVFYGLELRFVKTPEPTSLVIKRDTSGSYFLEWNPDPFWELVQSSQISGPYSHVFGQEIGMSRYFIPATSTNRFFQLRFNGR